MFKKVYEKKFPSQSDATSYLDSTGWAYNGRRGLLSKYHLYEGCEMTIDGEIAEHLKLKLYPDGHIKLFVDFAINRTLSRNLPKRVWPSKDIYNYMKKLVSDYNQKLSVDYGKAYIIKEQWSEQKCSTFGAYRLHEAQSGIGTVEEKQPTKSFMSAKEAFNWAKEKSQRNFL
ncbi:hypothetical protein [Halomonas sp. H10-9-1]|uniref:hypothetical protein n=1 Tax=Halomonas sp. H10-9-1 TaxID=2950871 RepID=UPI0032DF706C